MGGDGGVRCAAERAVEHLPSWLQAHRVDGHVSDAELKALDPHLRHARVIEEGHIPEPVCDPVVRHNQGTVNTVPPAEGTDALAGSVDDGEPEFGREFLRATQQLRRRSARRGHHDGHRSLRPIPSHSSDPLLDFGHPWVCLLSGAVC